MTISQVQPRFSISFWISTQQHGADGGADQHGREVRAIGLVPREQTQEEDAEQGATRQGEDLKGKVENVLNGGASGGNPRQQ